MMFAPSVTTAKAPGVVELLPSLTVVLGNTAQCENVPLFAA